MKILGIDQSLSSTGWCLKELGHVVHYGIIGSDKNKSRFARMDDIACELLELVDKYKPDMLILEGLPFGRLPGNSSRDLAGLQAVIAVNTILSKYQLDDTFRIIPPTTLKKFATGSGKAQKQDMFDSLPPEIKAKFQTTPKSRGRSDITDAYWLATIGEDL